MRAAFSTKILPRSKCFLVGTAVIGASKRPFQRSLEFSRSLSVQTLLPLHFSFWRTTLKNDMSGIAANCIVFFAFRI